MGPALVRWAHLGLCRPFRPDGKDFQGLELEIIPRQPTKNGFDLATLRDFPRRFG